MKRIIMTAMSVVMAVMLSGCGSKEGEYTLAGFDLIDQADYAGAMQSFATAIENGENEELVYRGIGIAYLGQAEYDNAVDSFKTALSHGGIFAGDLERDINFYMATAYYKSERPAEAAEILDAIIASDEKNAYAHYERGAIAITSGEYETGIYHFEKAIENSEDPHAIKFEIYDILAANDYEQKGREYLDSMLNDEKGLSEYEQGLIYFRLEQYDEARTHLEIAKQEEKDRQSEIVYMLGRTYEMLGDSNYAGVLYSEYLTKDPSSALMYNQLGLSKLAAGDAQAAVSAFESGLEQNDTSMRQALSFNRIAAYEAKGDFDTAKTLMNDYRLAYPDDEAAAREANFLKTR